MSKPLFARLRPAGLAALAGLLSIAGLPPAQAAPPARFTVVDLGTFGGSYSEAYGINASGQVVGSAATSAGGAGRAFLYTGGQLTDLNLPGTFGTARAIDAAGNIAGYYYDGSYEAFMLSGGHLTDLGTLGDPYSVAYALSPSGQACGSSLDSTGEEHAFLWSNGTMTDINAFGGDYSSARGVNASGTVVGYSYLASGAFHAFVRNGALVTDLGTLGGSYSEALAVNGAGQVVGQAYLPGNVKAHAFLWSGSGALKDLGDLGGNYSEALALNSTGSQIVGRATIPGGQFLTYHAFIHVKGKMRDLNALIGPNTGWLLTEATGINDAGQIVGNGTIHGENHAFLLNPK